MPPVQPLRWPCTSPEPRVLCEAKAIEYGDQFNFRNATALRTRWTITAGSHIRRVVSGDVMLEWIRMAPTAGASFAASLVECVEALTVVLAVGTIRGWRWALAGSGAAVLTLVLLVGILGPSIALIPLTIAQLVVGTLLLLFGLRWVRKAILRYVRVIPPHDEEAVYLKQTSSLTSLSHSSFHAWDGVAFASSFKIVMLEGMEVVFIVIAIGAGGPLIAPAAVGAIAAFALVLALGASRSRPREFAKIPRGCHVDRVWYLLGG